MSKAHTRSDKDHVTPKAYDEGYDLADRVESDILPAFHAAKGIMSSVCNTLSAAGANPKKILKELHQVFRTMLGRHWRKSYESVLHKAEYINEQILGEIRLPEIDMTSIYAKARPLYEDDEQPSSRPSVGKVITSNSQNYVENLEQLRVGEQDTFPIYPYWGNLDAQTATCG